MTAQRPRPHIPLEVRCRVVLRQLGEIWIGDVIACHRGSLGRLLRDKQAELAALLGCAPKDLRLDHEPALVLRAYNPRIKDIAARYTPNANDPEALLYRDHHSHHIKTHRVGDGAHRSDTAERVHQRRLAQNRAKRLAKTQRQKPRKLFKSYAGAALKRTSRPIPSRPNPWGPKGTRPFRRTP